MAILVDKDTKLAIAGLTGRQGRFHGKRNKDYGTDLVAGVTPGKGGEQVEGVPVFDTHRAVAETGANTAMVSSRRRSPPMRSRGSRRGHRTIIASPRVFPRTTWCGSTTTCRAPTHA